MIKKEIDGIEYILSRRAKKYINISVRNNEVFVSAPKRVPQYEIEKVHRDKASWIKEKLKNQKSMKNEWKDSNLVWYKGLQYELKVALSAKNGVDVFGNTIIVSTRTEEKEYVEKIFEKWIYQQAEETYQREVSRWLSIMEEYHLEMPRIQIRKMKTRWGSCIPSKKKICLNLALMYTPTACMEYVVLHELTHFIEANHSKNFYFIVQKYMPDWKARKDKLNKDFGNIL